MNDPGQPAPEPESTQSSAVPQPPAPAARQPDAFPMQPPPPAGPWPLSFGQILDRVFKLMRSHFWSLTNIAAIPMIVCMAIVAVPIVALAFSAQPQQGSPTEISWLPWGWTVAGFIVLCVFCMCAFALAKAASIYAALAADRGERPALGQCATLVRPHAGRFMGLMCLMYLYAYAPFLLGYIAVAGGTLLASHGTTAAFFILPIAFILVVGGYVYSIILMLRLSLAFPVCIVENLTAVEAIRRSGKLTSGAKGRIFLFALILYAGLCVLEMLGFAAMAISASIGTYAAKALGLHFEPPFSYLGIAAGVLSMAVFIYLLMGVSWAALTVGLAVFYRDQRLRIDGVALPVAP